MNVVDIIISCMIMNFIDIIVIGRINGENINIFSMRFILPYIVMIILIFLSYVFVPDYLRAISTFLIMALISKIMYKDYIKLCILRALILEILTILSEIIFSIIISVINNLNSIDYAHIFHGTILANFFISLIIYIIAKLINLHDLYNKINKLVKYISVRKILILFFLVLWCLNIIFYLSFYNKNSYITLIFNIIIGVIYFVIVLMFMTKDNKYNRIYLKYMKSLENLEEYENIINEYRVINHENKNQLLCIKGMTKNKKVIEYLDEVIGGKNNHSDILIQQALLIPIGGLRGLIYSKLVFMKNNQINYKLNIDKKLNSKLFSKLSSKDLMDICQIMGVYIDNAVEETIKIKNSLLVINIYFEDNSVYFETINSIEQIIDTNKLGTKRYTTKKGDHGYGLMLVKKILKENNNLSVKTIVTNKIFKQQLKFTIKK